LLLVFSFAMTYAFFLIFPFPFRGEARETWRLCRLVELERGLLNFPFPAEQEQRQAA